LVPRQPYAHPGLCSPIATKVAQGKSVAKWSAFDRLLARRPEGVFVNPFERGEIGPEGVPDAAGGMVSKRRDRPYQAGPSKYWLKEKNRKHPVMSRVMDAFAKHANSGSGWHSPAQHGVSALAGSRHWADLLNGLLVT
jgi:bifunctional non-homologous end joining protein LigD